MTRRGFAVLVAVLMTLSSSVAFVTGGGAAAEDGVIPGKYIVVLRDGVQDVQGEVARLSGKHGLAPDHIYHAALKGFAASMSAQKAAALAADGNVASVTPDRVVRALPEATARRGGAVTQPAQQAPTGVRRIGIDTTNAARNKGTGVGVAVIDTGIDLSHPDLQANIAGNVTFVRRTSNGNDDNGHGTHVAGTIAALDNGIGVVGVAPESRLYAVKVLDRNGSGTWSSVIAGVDWVTQRAGSIRVASMSLGGAGSSDNNCGKSNNDALHQAICKSVAAGVTYVVAAGNSSADASTSVPAAYNDAVITVSAVADSDGAPGHLGPSTPYGADDSFATFSNYGSVVDIAAPGVNILSTWKGGGYNTISGTSMSTPHVSGAAALYIKTHPTATAAEVRSALVVAGYPQDGPNGFTGDPDSSHEPLLYAGGF